MPDTATLERPTTDIRDRLRESIRRIQAAEARLAELEAGQSRAAEQLRTANGRLSDAVSALTRAQGNESVSLTNAFLRTGQAVTDPIASAQSIVNTETEAVTQLERVEAALTTEIERLRATLQTLYYTRLGCISQLVTTSPEYEQLLQDHKDAWHRLRSIKTALSILAGGLRGQSPQRLLDLILYAEPLESRVHGYIVDEDYVGAW
jgi:septal ring factor EnvC (AmiA/AmiB activator)